MIDGTSQGHKERPAETNQQRTLGADAHASAPPEGSRTLDTSTAFAESEGREVFRWLPRFLHPELTAIAVGVLAVSSFVALPALGSWSADIPPADSPAWWTLTDDLTPDELRSALIDPRMNKERLLRSRVQARDGAEVGLFVDGETTPELVPYWLAFSALAHRYEDWDGALWDLDAELEAFGLSDASRVAIVESAEAASTREAALAAAQESSAQELLDLASGAAQDLGWRSTTLGLAGGNPQALGEEFGVADTEINDLLTSVRRSPSYLAAVEVLESLVASLPAREDAKLRDYLLTEVAPGIVVQGAGTPCDNLEGNDVIRIDRFDYQVNEGSVSPDYGSVWVRARASYSGTACQGEHLQISCGLSTGDDLYRSPPQYVQNQRTAAVISGHETSVTCAGVGHSLIPRCTADGRDMPYLGSAIAGIATAFPDLGPTTSRKFGQRRELNCPTGELFGVGGEVSGVPSNVGISLYLAYIPRDQSPQLASLPFLSNGPFEFPGIPDGSYYEVTFEGSTFEGLSCTVDNGSNFVRGRPVANIRVRCETDLYKLSGNVDGLIPHEWITLTNTWRKPGSSSAHVSRTTRHGSGEFEFRVASGALYEIEVERVSNGDKTCTVTNGAHTMPASPVANVQVSCTCTNGAPSCDEGRPDRGDLGHIVPTPTNPGFCVPALGFCAGWGDPPGPWIPGPGPEVPGPGGGEEESCTTECREGPPICHDLDGDGTKEFCSFQLICTPVCQGGQTLVLEGPSLAIHQPAVDAVVQGGSLVVRGLAVDDDEVAALFFYLDEHEVTPQELVRGLPSPRVCSIGGSECSESAGYRAVLDISGLAPGDHSVDVLAIDRDLPFPAYTLEHRPFSVAAPCTSAPGFETTFAEPLAGETVEGTTRLVALAGGGASRVDFLLDGIHLARATETVAGRFEYSWDTRGLTGAHRLGAVAWNECGNRTESPERTVFVDGGIQVALVGSGTPVVPGSTFDFGTNSVGVSTSRHFSLCNLGLATLTLEDPLGLVLPATAFRQIGNPPTQTVPPANCTDFRVRFHVAQLGFHTGRVEVVAASGSHSTFEFSVAGTAVAATPRPRLEWAWSGEGLPNGGSFSFVPGATPGVPTSRLFRLCNDGTADLAIANPAGIVSGFGFSQIGTPPATTVPAGGCTEFRVRFHVAAPGSYTGMTSIETNADTNPYRVALEGVASEPGGPQLVVFTSPGGRRLQGGEIFEYPGTEVQVPSSQLFHLCNHGAADLEVSSVSVTGHAFRQIGIPPASTVAPAGCTAVRLRFHSATPGFHSGQATFRTNDLAADPFTVELHGSALEPSPPRLRLEQAWDGEATPHGTRFDFPATSLASLPISRQFRICNDGESDLDLANPSTLVSGPGFSQIGTQPSGLIEPEACTTARVRFHVANAGSYSGVLEIRSNDPSTPAYRVTLAGVAEPDGSSEIRVSLAGNSSNTVAAGSTFEFPAIPVATTPISRLFDICNDGSGTLLLPSVTGLVGGFGFSQIDTPPAGSVLPGECAQVRVRFHVLTPGAYSGVVSIESNDALRTPYVFYLSATAVP